VKPLYCKGLGGEGGRQHPLAFKACAAIAGFIPQPAPQIVLGWLVRARLWHVLPLRQAFVFAQIFSALAKGVEGYGQYLRRCLRPRSPPPTPSPSAWGRCCHSRQAEHRHGLMRLPQGRLPISEFDFLTFIARPIRTYISGQEDNSMSSHSIHTPSNGALHDAPRAATVDQAMVAAVVIAIACVASIMVGGLDAGGQAFHVGVVNAKSQISLDGRSHCYGLQWLSGMAQPLHL
jgi:hypothetical protein